MGANQSAGRTIPVRPRTPLRFGSAPPPLPVNPGRFGTGPRSYARTERPTGDSVSSLLSQESYFGGYAPAPQTVSPGSGYTTYSQTRSISPLSSSSDSPMPHLFTCPKQNCPYAVIGYSTSEELEEHMFAVGHFASGPITGIEFDSGDWLSPQDIAEMYPQHPLTLQRQRISGQQQKQQQVQQSQQCNCYHCLHSDYNSYIQYQPQEPSMQIQMPPPPTIIGYHDAGFELVSWRQPGSSYQSPSSQQINQAEYSSLVQSGMYMDFNQVGAPARSSFM